MKEKKLCEVFIFGVVFFRDNTYCPLSSILHFYPPILFLKKKKKNAREKKNMKRH